MMNRRSFLTGGAKVAAAVVAAPWVVRAESLMPIVARRALAPAYFGIDLGLPDGGYTMVQWITATGDLIVRSFDCSGVLAIPEGVYSAWVSSVRGGGGIGKPISPYRDDRGQIFDEPLAVVPGSLIRIGHRDEAGPV